MPDFEDEDEDEQHVQQGRLSRFLKLGGLTTTVGASVVGEKILGRVLPKDERDRRVQKNMEKNAARMVKTMGELKGAAMKIGQMLSTVPLDESTVPNEVKDALAVLQRSAPPMGWTMVCDQVEAAFDRPIHDVFRFFDSKPLAAASIGQVHRAELFDGTQVAVKIQYPGVTESLDADLKNMASMAQIGRAFVSREKVEEIIDEIREVLLAESDYEAEAKNLTVFREKLALREDLRVPRPFPEYTRKTVLTMEFIEGKKLDDWLLEQTQERRNQVSLHFVEVFAWMFHELQVLHADPHPGNFLIDDQERFVLLDFGAVREYTPRFTDGIIALLAAIWEDKPERLPSIYEDLGFGSEEKGVEVAPEVLAGWLRIVCEPFFTYGDFDFGTWAPHAEASKYPVLHPSILTVTPPREAVFYGRVCAGCWGFLQRMGVKANFYTFAAEIARRRGVFAGPDPAG